MQQADLSVKWTCLPQNKGSKEEQVMDGCSTPTQLSNEETHSGKQDPIQV